MTHVIFTGGNYFEVDTLPTGKGDLVVGIGKRWIKSQRQFADKARSFVTSKHYQVLTEAEVASIRRTK